MYILKDEVKITPRWHFIPLAIRTIDQRWALNMEGMLAVALKRAR